MIGPQFNSKVAFLEIPAKAGIQLPVNNTGSMDPRLRGDFAEHKQRAYRTYPDPSYWCRHTAV
jgi:hypothetical protein